MIFSARSFILVTIQFLCLGVLFFSGPPVAHHIGSLIIELFSVFLALWAIMVMRAGKLNVFPELRTGARLISRGPYHLIRHPMYLSVILFGLSLILNFFTWFRLGVWVVLCTDLLLKIRYEEKLLVSAILEYKTYRQTTKKLLPFIF